MDGGGSEWEYREHGIEREGIHGCRGRISNCLLRRLLFSCTGLTACFFMHTLKGPACMCVSLTLTTNRSRISGYEKSCW